MIRTRGREVLSVDGAEFALPTRAPAEARHTSPLPRSGLDRIVYSLNEDGPRATAP